MKKKEEEKEKEEEEEGLKISKDYLLFVTVKLNFIYYYNLLNFFY